MHALSTAPQSQRFTSSSASPNCNDFLEQFWKRLTTYPTYNLHIFHTWCDVKKAPPSDARLQKIKSIMITYRHSLYDMRTKQVSAYRHLFFGSLYEKHSPWYVISLFKWLIHYFGHMKISVWCFKLTFSYVKFTHNLYDIHSDFLISLLYTCFPFSYTRL